MRVLHTSDWHLGRSLFGQKRYEEFSAFLDWLARTLQEKGARNVLVSMAGDGALLLDEEGQTHRIGCPKGLRARSCRCWMSMW